MSKMQMTATSVEDYLSKVLDIKTQWGLWYRGHADAEWKLRPRLYRQETARKAPDRQIREKEDNIREEFVVLGANLSDVRPTSKWDWYFVMQHYGAPTRLLDWTDGALIGLYFAVRENNGCQDAAVWVLDGWKLNRKVVGRAEVIPPGDPGTAEPDKDRYDRWLHERFEEGKKWPLRPAAIFPGHIMRRIGAQRSCFTIHGRDRRSLDEIAHELGVPITSIVIPSWKVEAIKQALKDCGIDETTVFPDLEGLSRYLSFAWDEEDRLPPHHKVYTRLRPSKRVKGEVGVFAIRKIKKGARLFEGDNEEMVWIDASKLPRGPDAVRRLYEDFSVRKTDTHDKKKRYGCPTSFNRLTVSWYLNDSKTPNVRCDKRYNFLALKDIERGEELTVDYSTYSE